MCIHICDEFRFSDEIRYSHHIYVLSFDCDALVNEIETEREREKVR